MQEIYTTGEVAKILNVAPRTVNKWCDSNKLKSYLIPGSSHRRIKHNDLSDFMLEHGLETPDSMKSEFTEQKYYMLRHAARKMFVELELHGLMSPALRIQYNEAMENGERK